MTKHIQDLEQQWAISDPYRQFINVAMDCEVGGALKPYELFTLGTALREEPKLKARHDAKYNAWWDSMAEKLAALDVDNPDDDFQLNPPDFWIEVAMELTRAEKLILRKKYLKA